MEQTGQEGHTTPASSGKDTGHLDSWRLFSAVRWAFNAMSVIRKPAANATAAPTAAAPPDFPQHKTVIR